MTYTAIELIRNPELAIDPMTVEITDSGKKGYSPHELDIFKINHEDIHKLVAKIFEEGRTTKVKKGKHKGDVVHAPPTVVKNLRQFITDASFEDNLERTPTFTLVVHDPDWEILNTGIIDEPFDINPGKIKNRFYSLTSCSVNDDEITLIFSTTNAVLLMHEHRPMKANRNSMTRAQFIKGLT
ncbi:MAG TPA: hypothetical protein VNS88_13600, partial [Nitrospiraceae bacterium]|nr:hypothetical protein [Nitrospiraceae bacterium]